MVVMNDTEKDIKTGFLFATPSFWSGAGRLLDLWGKFDDYNVGRSSTEADMRALYSDWRIVGQDLRDAWLSFHTEEAEPQNRESDSHAYKCQLCGKTLAVPLTKRIHGRKHG